MQSLRTLEKHRWATVTRQRHPYSKEQHKKTLKPVAQILQATRGIVKTRCSKMFSFRYSGAVREALLMRVNCLLSLYPPFPLCLSLRSRRTHQLLFSVSQSVAQTPQAQYFHVTEICFLMTRTKAAYITTLALASSRRMVRCGKKSGPKMGHCTYIGPKMGHAE